MTDPTTRAEKGANLANAAIARGCMSALESECRRLRGKVTATESRAASAETEVEKLTRERDEALCLAEGPSSLKEMASHFVGRSLELYNAEASASALRDRVAVLESALKPFAKAGELFPPRGPGDYDQLVYGPAAGPEYNLSGDHLRAARSALAQQAKGEGEGGGESIAPQKNRGHAG